MSELWRRLGFLAFALLVYRIGTHIPIPGINPEQVAAATCSGFIPGIGICVPIL